MVALYGGLRSLPYFVSVNTAKGVPALLTESGSSKNGLIAESIEEAGIF